MKKSAITAIVPRLLFKGIYLLYRAPAPELLRASVRDWFSDWEDLAKGPCIAVSRNRCQFGELPMSTPRTSSQTRHNERAGAMRYCTGRKPSTDR
jgi:hypothetical protein